MALESKLDLRLTQKLILTPQLQQAIKLLQMPQLELAQVLNQELTENPFLEEHVEEAEREEYREDDRGENTPQAASTDEPEVPFESLLNFNFTVDDYFADRSSDGRDLGYFTPGTEDQPSYELFYSRQPGLADHLLWQLRLSRADDSVRRIAENVIGNIDEDGYLRSSEEELAQATGADPETILSAIRLIQEFDPIGVGARNLRECLSLQIAALDLEDTLVQKIVEQNLDDLQKRKYGQIAKMHGVTPDEVMAAVRVIEGLEPKPGRNFSVGDVNYITPDVYISKSDEGYQIVLNDDSIPKLRLNHSYRKLLQQREMFTKEEREFMREKLRLATELMKSLSQRNKTIFRVSESILKFQREFFDGGIQQLKPLNLKDVALDISMHESTISRVTSNKYLSCDHGVFSFRFFFSSALHSEKGDVSSFSVKDIIKKIVADEDHSKPLSDQAIAEMLKSANISIARRTVAKYREELKIPPQNQRKRFDKGP